MSDSGGDMDRMTALLHEHGIVPARNRGPIWKTELGHYLYMGHTPHAGWHLSVTHLGDPAGAGLSIPLGTHDDEEAVSRVAAEMRNRETVGHMGDMYQRALLNNDPTGMDPGARRVPVATGDWHQLNHYE